MSHRQRRRNRFDQPISRVRPDDGETVLGTALLFPIVLFGLFMIIQILLGYYVRAVASAAATDAAVLTAQENATSAQGANYAETFILEQAGGLVLPEELTVQATKGTEFATVTVTGRTRLVWSVELEASASAPVERFEPQVNP
jgi:Flp pilus assembly protein TadG